MTLWNIIRDFFIQYIFGGTASNGVPYNENIIAGEINTNNYAILNDITLGNWLSTTATIIVLIGICLAIWHFVRWLFRLTAGLIRG